METTDDRLMDLLLRWDELRLQGRPPTAETLCPDDPELQARLRERIRKRERIEAMLQPATVPAAETVATAPAIPDVPGYEILEVIGHGGMGVVYKARQHGLNRLVALKMILSGSAASPTERARFIAEAEAAARLQHPNIVQVYEVGEHAGRHFLAMEYVPGGSLAARLTGDGIDPRRAAELILPLAEAVHHAHSMGVIHRDLKPANILLISAECGVRSAELEDKFSAASPAFNSALRTPHSALHPKVADFGLAKRMGEDGGHTQTGAILGSPAYMPPEQALGDAKSVGPAADVYALGAILYELLAGRPPFKGGTLLETLELVRTGDVLPPRHFRARLPRDLETICLKCLQKDPARRYATAEALADDLRRFLAEEPIEGREDGIGSQLARLVGRKEFDARVYRFAFTSFWLAPWGILVEGSLYFGWRDHPHYAYYALGGIFFLLLVMVLVLLLANQGVMREIPSVQRRQHRTVWGSHLVASCLIVFVVCWTARIERPDDLLIILPLLVIQGGTSIMAQASQVGMMYVTGAVFYLVALVMALNLPLAPLIGGCLMTVNTFLQGVWLRRQGARTDQNRLADPTSRSNTGKLPSF